MPLLALLFLALVVYLLVMPAVAGARANRALREVDRLQSELRALRKALGEQHAGSQSFAALPAPGNAEASVIPPVPVVSSAIRHPEAPLKPRASWEEPRPVSRTAAVASTAVTVHSHAPPAPPDQGRPARAAARPPAMEPAAPFSLEQFLGVK